jgi:hypothetical protein
MKAHVRPHHRRVALLFAFALLLLSAAPAAAGRFRASLGFSFADNNVLRGAGETRINSPSAYFGQTPDSYFRALGGSEFGPSRLHLFAYGGALDLHPRFVPEGAVVLLLDPSSGTFRDDGTYLRVGYYFDSDRRRGVSLTMHPIDSDRERLGFHYDISWGGSAMFPKNFRRGLVPGLRLQLDLGWMYAYTGMKTALVRSPTEDILDNPGGNTNKIVERANYAVFGGLGFDIYRGLRLEVNGGYFQKGTNTRPNVLGRPIHAGGLSGQLSYHHGLSIGRRIDMYLYTEDPIRFDILAREEYGSGLSWNVAIEGTGVVQTLEDPERARSTINEWAFASMASARFKFSHFRIHLEGIYRTLTYITYNVPGFVPYQALPAAVESKPELTALVSADYFIAPISLTVGLTFGVLRPATYRGVVPAGSAAPTTLQGVHTVVVRGAESGGDWDILPAGEEELPVFYIKGNLKWTFGDTFAALAELTYGRDPNLSQVFRDFRGHAIRTFDDPNVLAFGLLARLAF